MNFKLHLILALFASGIIIFPDVGYTQNILLEEIVDADTVPQKFGPNQKNYTHSFLGYGLILGSSEGKGMDVKAGNSNEFITGFRYKRKITNWYAVGLEIAYGVASFHLRQNDEKIYPDTVLHDKEKISLNNFGIQLYQRFNFDKRGNIIGKYMDVGGYFDWAFLVKHYTKDKHDKPSQHGGAKSTEVTQSGLIYTQPYNYGVSFRVGYNAIAVFGKYRLSDLFKPHHNLPELPRITVGLELGILN